MAFNFKNSFARFLQRRNFNNQEWLRDWLRGKEVGTETFSGIPISPERAIQYSAILACSRILSEGIASVPLFTYKRINDGKEKAVEHSLYNILHLQPNEEMTSFSFREMMMLHLIFWGNFYAEIVEDEAGQVTALWPLLPWKMTIFRDSMGKIGYKYKLPDNTDKFIPKDYMLHIPGLSFDGLVGKSLISCAREAIGLGLALEEFGARFFGQGTQFGGFIEHPKTLGEKPEANLKAALKEKYQGITNSHRIIILEEAMHFNPNSIPPDEAQFLESRKFQKNEIAMIFNVSPHLLKDLDRATFNNIEQLGIEHVVYTLRPWCVRIEQYMTIKLLTPTERQVYFIEFLLDGLLRGDIASRYAAYAIGRQWGWLSANDVRKLENMNPLPNQEGDIYLIPLNMTDASSINGVKDLQNKTWLTVNEKRIAEGLEPLPGGDAIYMASDLIPAIEIEEDTGKSGDMKKSETKSIDIPDLEHLQQLLTYETRGIKPPFGNQNATVSKTIIANLPPHKRYVEPFADGGSTALNLKKKRAKEQVLNIVDEDLFFAFTFARDYTQADKKKLQTFDWIGSQETFDKVTSINADGGPERFYKFLYLKKFGMSMEKDTPPSFNPLDTGKDISNLVRGASIMKIALKNATILNEDPLSVISKYNSSDTFMVLKPPDPETTDSVRSKLSSISAEFIYFEKVKEPMEIIEMSESFKDFNISPLSVASIMMNQFAVVTNYESNIKTIEEMDLMDESQMNSRALNTPITRIAANYRSLFEETILRVIKFERSNILKVASSIFSKKSPKLASFTDYLEEFYKNNYDEINKRVKPVINTYGKIVADASSFETGLTVNNVDLDKFMSEYSEDFNKRYIASSKHRITDAAEYAHNDNLDLYKEIESSFNEMEQTRPQTVASEETVKIADALSLFMKT